MTLEQFWAHVRKSDGCWLWTGYVDHRGYGRLTWRGQNYRLAHRVSYELAHADPAGLCVCHRCDNPLCVRPEHLFLGTRADNNRDMVAKGRQAAGERSGAHTHPEKIVRGDAHHFRRRPDLARRIGEWVKSHPESIKRGDAHHFRLRPETHPRGERVGGAKLNESKVREIRRRAAVGERLYEIARDFGVSDVLVSRIVRRKQWAHVV